MFPNSNTHTTTLHDPEIAEQHPTEAIPKTYNYWRWAKWGGVAAGIAVIATVGIYYGGEPFIAALSALGTGFMSLFGRSGQGTALVPVEQYTGIRDVGYTKSESQLPIV